MALQGRLHAASIHPLTPSSGSAGCSMPSSPSCSSLHGEVVTSVQRAGGRGSAGAHLGVSCCCRADSLSPAACSHSELAAPAVASAYARLTSCLASQAGSCARECCAIARQVLCCACCSAARLSAARDSWLGPRECSAVAPSASKAAAALLALAGASARRDLYWLNRWSVLTSCLGDAAGCWELAAVLGAVPADWLAGYG